MFDRPDKSGGWLDVLKFRKVQGLTLCRVSLGIFLRLKPFLVMPGSFGISLFEKENQMEVEQAERGCGRKTVESMVKDAPSGGFVGFKRIDL